MTGWGVLVSFQNSTLLSVIVTNFRSQMIFTFNFFAFLLNEFITPCLWIEEFIDFSVIYGTSFPKSEK